MSVTSVTTEVAAEPKVSFWNDPKVRAWIAQIVLVAIVVWLGYEVVTNTIRNLAARNIASGLGFLNSTAGFDIIQTPVQYDRDSTYGRAFLVGLLNTLIVAGIGIVCATVLGFLVGIMRLSRNWVIAKIATVYVEVIRNIPLLLQIFFWYFAVLRTLPNPRDSVNILGSVFVNNRGLYMPRPVFGAGAEWIGVALVVALVAAWMLARWARRRQEQTGEQFPSGWAALGLIVGLPLVVSVILGFPVTFDWPVLQGFNFVGGTVIIPELVSLTFALSIYTAAFIGEIVRAGILAVSHGQTEAASALGLRRGRTLRLIIVPQAMRVIIPPLTSQYLNITKNSSLAVAIAYPDLVSVFAGTVLNQTGQAIEIILITMLVYLTLSILTSGLMNWYNARIALVER
jgi:general L-amino acid transport system permease protein